MSNKPASKDDYGPPIDPKPATLITPDNFTPTPITPTSYPPLRRPTTAEILTKNPPRLESNPLLKTSNKYSLLSHTTSIISDKPSLTITQKIDNDEFLQKPNYQNIFPIEAKWNNENPLKIASRIIPNPYNYPYEHIGKDQKWYEFLLIDTDSIELTHNRCQNGKILFSKVKILKILSYEDWATSPYKSRNFSRRVFPPEYNYYDYIKAWERFLFITEEKHSWFIWFKKGISLKFPRWFLLWFNRIGPEENFFPPELNSVYQYFKEYSSFLPTYQLISFIAAQGVSWIIKWEYKISIGEYGISYLIRQYYYKWWKKFDISTISKDKITMWIKLNKSSESHETSKMKNEELFLEEKKKIIAELMASTSQDEFEERIRMVRSATTPLPEKSDESTSNPYLDNHDMLEGYLGE